MHKSHPNISKTHESQSSYASKANPFRAIVLRILALSFTVASTIPLFARDKTDMIVMNNGDRLTGKIKEAQFWHPFRERNRRLHPRHQLGGLDRG